jgi:hypothetical protein
MHAQAEGGYKGDEEEECCDEAVGAHEGRYVRGAAVASRSAFVRVLLALLLAAAAAAARLRPGVEAPTEVVGRVLLALVLILVLVLVEQEDLRRPH